MAQTDYLRLLDDPDYTAQYHEIRDILQSEAADGLKEIFHVGSTAISDLDGKPELDIIAVYQDLDTMDAAARVLSPHGFERMDENESSLVSVLELENRAEIVKFHLPGDERVKFQLLGREYLSDHEEARREYEAIKREAMAADPEHREAYTAAKTEFISELNNRAIDAGYEDHLPESI